MPTLKHRRNEITGIFKCIYSSIHSLNIYFLSTDYGQDPGSILGHSSCPHRACILPIIPLGTVFVTWTIHRGRNEVSWHQTSKLLKLGGTNILVMLSLFPFQRKSAPWSSQKYFLNILENSSTLQKMRLGLQSPQQASLFPQVIILQDLPAPSYSTLSQEEDSLLLPELVTIFFRRQRKCRNQRALQSYPSGNFLQNWPPFPRAVAATQRTKIQTIP